MNKKYHYTYMSTDGEKFYIGVRSSNKHPLDDPYLGSGKEIRRKNFIPTSKIILGLHFDRNDSILAEKYWLKLFNVKHNRLFTNLTNDNDNKFSNYGEKLSEEHKLKISNSLSGENHPFYGKELSEIHKKNLSKALKNRSFSEETRRKLSEAHKGKYLSPETREKISQSKKGFKHTEETKKKISKAFKGKNHPNYDHTLYLFIYKSQIQEICTRSELYTKYNLSRQHTSDIINGKLFTHKGWKCLCLLT